MTPDITHSAIGNSNSATPSNDFVRWMEIAGERHRKIKKIHRRASDVEKARALDYANEAGEALFLIKKDRQEKHDRDRSNKGWVKWVKAELPFTYATANTYIRINYYWSDLEDLEERSIRGAIRRIQEIEGKAPRQRSRGRVKVKRAAFIAAAMKSGLSEIVANPNLGCAFYNEISQLAGFRDDIALGTDEEADSSKKRKPATFVSRL